MALTIVAQTGIKDMAVVGAAPPVEAITGIKFWNPGTVNWQTDPPTLAVGRPGGVRATGYNTGTSAQDMVLVFEVTDPAGVKTTFEAMEGVWKAVAVGDYMVGTCPEVTLSKEGDWKANVVLKAGGTEVARVSDKVFATVVAPVGEITDVKVLNPDTGEYEPRPFEGLGETPALYAGQKTAIGATAKNTGTAAQKMQLVFNVIKPDESVVAYPDEEQTVDAGKEFIGTTPAIELTIIGEWKASVALKSGETVLDSTEEFLMWEAKKTQAMITNEMIGQMMGLMMMGVMMSMVVQMRPGEE